MTKKEILEILRDVFFVDYRITEEENSKLSKIYITYLKL